MKINTFRNYLAVMTGVFFLVLGVRGIFSLPTFGLFIMNHWCTAILLLFGLFGIYSSYKKISKAFCLVIGLILIITGLLGFFDQTSPLLADVLKINDSMFKLNILIGTVLFIGGLLRPPDPVVPAFRKTINRPAKRF